LCGVLKEELYSNPRNKDELKKDTQNVVFSVSPAQIGRVVTNKSV